MRTSAVNCVPKMSELSSTICTKSKRCAISLDTGAHINPVDTTTGISAYERTLTAKKLIDPSSEAKDFNRPGHLFPLVAQDKGTPAGLAPVSLAKSTAASVCPFLANTPLSCATNGNNTLTAKKLIDPSSEAKDFNRPGHLFPLVAQDKGVTNDTSGLGTSKFS
jgi:3,4-dihydroxy-2-butanone 4-phosphate synthase